MTTVSSFKEISALFANAHNNFPAIIRKPSDDYVQRLCRSNFQSLQDINLGEGTDTTGLILSEVDHRVVPDPDGIHIPFLRANNLHSSLLLMKTRSFFTLFCVGGKYTRLVYSW